VKAERIQCFLLPRVYARVVVTSHTEYVLWNSGWNYSDENRCLFTLVSFCGKNELPRQGFLLVSGNQRRMTKVSLSFNWVINNFVHIDGENLQLIVRTSWFRYF